MNKILIIGAGQLGSRHLQGALQSSLPLNITVVDPSSDSLSIAQQRAEQVSIENVKSTVQYSQSLPKAESFDVCIIATSAPVRAKVTASLLAENKVCYIIFEKVLFQALHEYTEVAALLEQHNVTAWVNCPRRLYPSYQQIKELINPNEILAMKVSGSGWGMACNSIHFIDLFSYLCNQTDLQASESNLDTQLLESKRAGFYELTGKAKFMLGHHSLELECTTADEVAIQVSLSYDSNTISIDEIAGTINTGIVSTERQFKHQVKYQSDLTGLNIDEILNTDTSSLTPFNDSCQLHTPMVQLYLEHINNVLNKNLLACPIT
ncbi:Gfo/Idh/MocA family oxidoreductase [Shewanella sp.]|uniref:Gfo/Idh/MocA family oxidoreductase n=3 Tax=Shewanella sp. TaxID=50422 RepID=UPI00404858B6